VTDPEARGADDPTDRPDDRALLEAHLAGDPTAFGELVGRHRDRLWAVALRTTGNPEDAADALQDAMISAFRRAEGFRGDSAVTTWLHRIVVNACLDRLRRVRVRAADPLPDDLEDHAARGAVVAGAAPDAQPEAQAIAGDQRRRVLAALDALPPDQKAALVLVDLEGYAVAEAAAVLEIPTGTVKSRCARGRARLAELLPDLRPGGTDRAPAASHSGDPPAARSPGSRDGSTDRPGVRPAPPDTTPPLTTGGEQP
jgi:RNA polymerase sigma-70 factor (ECF subfamily)